MPDAFKPSDDVLKELVNARREEVARMQKSLADHVKDLESRGRTKIASLRNVLPRDIVTALDALDKTHDEASAATKSYVEGIKTRLTVSVVPSEGETAIHPGLAGGHLVARRLPGQSR